jgi:hypothetical protein
LEYLAANIMGKASMVHIYFRDLGVEKYSTDELYNIVDLIGKITLLISFAKLSISRKMPISIS